MMRLLKLSIPFILIVSFLLLSCACSGQTEILTPEPENLPENIASTEKTDQAVKILFVNVHKADSAIVLTGNTAFLIDTGTAESVPYLIGALRYYGIQELEGVFLSHTHKDHIGGLKQICRMYPIRTVYRAFISENKKNGSNAIDSIAEDEGVPVSTLSAGDTLKIGDVLIETIGPLVYNSDDDNDNSLVLMLNAYGRKILMTGDMQFPEEETLLSSEADLKADVLKVGNHGNPDATSVSFARSVDPKLSIISTDTEIDTDSANPRVFAALSGSEIYTTEGTGFGVLLTIPQDGTIDISYPERPSQDAQIDIISADREQQMIVIRNTGSNMTDLSDAMLLSERKGDLVCFPEGTSLEPGGELTVSGYGMGGLFSFSQTDEPFSKKKQEHFLLYDRYGNLISEITVGQEE